MSSKALREKRKADGLCPYCGETAKPGYVMCEKCREKDRQKKAAMHTKRVEAGVCTVCGGKTDAQHVRCEECRAKDQEYQMGLRELRKSLMLCTECGEKAAPGKTKCELCLAHYAEYHSNRPQTEEEREKARAYGRERYGRLKNAGLCVKCGAPVYSHNGVTYTRCYEHYLQARRLSAQRAARLRMERWDVPKEKRKAPHPQKQEANHPWRNHNALLFTRFRGGKNDEPPATP